MPNRKHDVTPPQRSVAAYPRQPLHPRQPSSAALPQSSEPHGAPPHGAPPHGAPPHGAPPPPTGHRVASRMLAAGTPALGTPHAPTEPTLASLRTAQCANDASAAIASPSRRTLPWRRIVTLATLTVAFIALGITLWKVGPRAIYENLRRIGPWFAVIFAAEFITTGCDAYALAAFLRVAGKAVSWQRALLAQVAGRATSIVFPGGSVGDLVKYSMLCEDGQHAPAAAAVISYNLAHLAVELLRLAIGAPLGALLLPLPSDYRTSLFFIGAAAASASIALYLWVRAGLGGLVVRALARLRLISSARALGWRAAIERIDQILAAPTPVARRAQRQGFLAIMGSNLPGIFATAVLLHALGLPLSVGAIGVLVGIAPVIGWCSSVVPFGVGLAEALNVACFAAIGFPPAAGLTIALARRSVQLCYAGLGLLLSVTCASVRAARQPTH